LKLIKLYTNQKLNSYNSYTIIVVSMLNLETLEPNNKIQHFNKYLPFEWLYFNIPTCEIGKHEFGYISNVIYYIKYLWVTVNCTVLWMKVNSGTVYNLGISDTDCLFGSNILYYNIYFILININVFLLNYILYFNVIFVPTSMYI